MRFEVTATPVGEVEAMLVQRHSNRGARCCLKYRMFPCKENHAPANFGIEVPLPRVVRWPIKTISGSNSIVGEISIVLFLQFVAASKIPRFCKITVHRWHPTPLASANVSTAPSPPVSTPQTALDGPSIGTAWVRQPQVSLLPL